MVHQGSYTKGWTDGIQVLAYSRCETSGGKGDTASNTSSMELQHRYTFSCLRAYHVKCISHSSAQQIKKGYEDESITAVGTGEDRV